MDFREQGLGARGQSRDNWKMQLICYGPANSPAAEDADALLPALRAPVQPRFHRECQWREPIPVQQQRLQTCCRKSFHPVIGWIVDDIARGSVHGDLAMLHEDQARAGPVWQIPSHA